jgi:deoxyhypusine monooxygenase
MDAASPEEASLQGATGSPEEPRVKPVAAEPEPEPAPRPAKLTAEELAAFQGEEQEDDLTPHEMLLAQFPPMEDLRAALADPYAALSMRMRAVYYLRTISSSEAIDVLSTSLLDQRNTPLMRHELAYVLGQIRDPAACPVLEQVLADEGDDAMVRHESAEALGSIGAQRSLALLERCTHDTKMEVAETCSIAAEFVKWKQLRDETKAAPMMCACMNPYNSHDPVRPSSLLAAIAPGSAFLEMLDAAVAGMSSADNSSSPGMRCAQAPSDPEFDQRPTAEVAAVLIDESQPLFRRYSAMFSLRNRGGEEAVRALGGSLLTDQSSALFRHEVAFVLGQMQHPAAIEPLAGSLARDGEHGMVRHESAEALGAIEGTDEEWARCEEVLREYINDPDTVVGESCQVALDAADYWARADEFGEDGVKGFAELKRLSEKNPDGAASASCPLRGHFNITTPVGDGVVAAQKQEENAALGAETAALN